MDIEVFGSNLMSSGDLDERRKEGEKDRFRLKRKTLQAVLEQCQRAVELLSDTDGVDNDDDEAKAKQQEKDEPGRDGLAASPRDREADELCNLLKSRVGCPDFLEKLDCAQVSAPQHIDEEGISWDLVSENDLWEGENVVLDQEDYVLVKKEDIIEGISSFMAAYLLSLEQTKDLTPNQLKDALSKTFSVRKKKGKLRKAWEGSKAVYNVASWGATAIGIYQNPVLLRVFWNSYDVVSKLL